MRTVGQILKETRESKLYSLEDVEKQIKIRQELLEALEADDYDKLPPATFIQGFIKNYGRFLNLNTEKLLALFRRDYESKKHPPKVLESFSKPIRETKFTLNPSRVLGTLIAVIIIGFFAYLWFEYRQFVGPPQLALNSPQDQQTVEIPTVRVEGMTESEAKVMVNDQEIGVEKDGKFSEEIKLTSSVNKVTVTAVSKFGQQARIERTVFVKQ